MFKDKLIEIRKENNDTQELLGKKINVSRSLIAKWEQGRAYPGYEQIEDIAGAYNKPIEYLLSKYELKEVYGFYKKSNKVKTGIIIGTVSLLVLAIAAIVVIGTGTNNLNKTGTEYYSFNSMKKIENGYSFECDNGDTINANNDDITFSYFGNEWDEHLQLSKMNNGGKIQRDYSTNFNGIINNNYLVQLETPEFKNKDYMQCFFLDLKQEKELSTVFEPENCLYFRFEDVELEDKGKTYKVTCTNTNAYKYSKIYSYLNGKVILDAEFNFKIDDEKFEQYYKDYGHVEIFSAFIYGDGTFERRVRNPLFDDWDFENPLEGHQFSYIRCSSKTDGIILQFISGYSKYFVDNSMLVRMDGNTVIANYEINIECQKSAEKYEILEYNDNDQLLAKSEIKSFDELNNFVFNENTSYVYTNKFVNGKIVESERSDYYVALEFANDVGVFSKQSKKISK